MQNFWRLPMAEEESLPPEAEAPSIADAVGDSAERVLDPGPAGLLREIQEGRGPQSPKQDIANPGYYPGGYVTEGQVNPKALAYDQEKGAGGKRGWRGKGWRDFTADIPEKPPEPKEDTQMREQREREQQQLAVRDSLRGAATTAELKAAIESAEKLGMSSEVQMGRRKLSKMGE